MARGRRSEADLTAPAADDVYLTPDELAIRYSMHVDSIARWRGQQKGPRWTRIEGEMRYALSDVLAWEATQKGK